MVRGGQSGRCGTAVAVMMLLGSLSPPSHAADEGSGTSGAAFLKIPVGATASVLPEVVAGMRPDASMLFTNPSSLAHVPNRELFLTTSNWLDEFNLSAASIALPVRSWGMTWSTGARLLYSGHLKGYDATGIAVDDERYYDAALTTGFGKRFDGIGVSLGAGLTYVREHLAVEDGDGLALSMGASYVRGGHRVDLIAQDIGGRLEFEDRGYDIDSHYIVGYGRTFREGWGSMQLGSQVTFSHNEFERVDAGVAYGVNRHLTILSGFGHTTESTTENGLPLKAGLSVNVGGMCVDYAYSPQQYFSDTHTFSLRVSFGSREDWAAGELLNPPLTAPESPGQGVAAAGVDPGAASSYAIVAGTHGRLESAEAEAQALRLLNIPARAQSVGARYRVVIDRYEDQSEAAEALRSFRSQGHRFAIIVINE